MFVNYGDVNFFERGVLIDTEHSDTEFRMIRCEPYTDKEDEYQFNDAMLVDISDSWIDRQAVMSYMGMTEDTFDPIQFAIGCTDYYSWDNFGQPYSYNWMHMDRKSIEGHLRLHLIANDNLNIEW